MSYYNSNEAYDLSYFSDETYEEDQLEVKQEKAKLEQLEKKREEKKIRSVSLKKTLKKAKSLFGLIACGVVIAGGLGLLIYGNAISLELDNKIAEKQAELDIAVSENTQLDMKIDTILSPAVIERYATNVLNMSKVDDSKKEYIRLDEDDKVLVSNTDSNTLVDSAKEFFSNLF